MNDEDIKILEKFIKYYEAEAISRKFRGTLSIQVDEDDIQAIENLLKENEELKKLLNAKIGVDLSYEDYVPVAKIKEEIKHLHKNIQDIDNATMFKEKTLKEQTEIELYKYAICVLIRIWEGK